MTQTQLLLLLISVIPLANCFVVKFCDDSFVIVRVIEKLFPILFLINLIGVYGSLGRDNSYLVLAEATRGISLGFDVDRISLFFLILLNLFWFVLSFHTQRFLQMSGTRGGMDLKGFLALTIAFANLVIISKNLLSILFFYNCLVVSGYFFSAKFLHKRETKLSQFFTLLLYLESLFFFFAIVATYKFTGRIDFETGGVLGDIGSVKYVFLLILFLSGLFLSVLVPFYLLYRDINLDLVVIYGLFFLSYAFVSLYILIKILNSIFSFSGISEVILPHGLGFFEWAFLINILVASVCVALSKGLKSSFFYLVFQQFVFALFTIFLFVIFDESRIYVALLSFFLPITLIFLCISNFVLFLQKSENKSVVGLFYDLKATSLLFIFAVVSLTGLLPTINGMEKFLLIKIIVQKKLVVAGLACVVNFLGLLTFAWKNIYPIFLRPKVARSQNDQDFAREVDFDSSLILTTTIMAISTMLSLVFFQFLTEFL